MTSPVNMQAKPATPPTAGLDIGEIQYIFFRHKWMILLIFLAGIATAAAIYFFRPPMYISEAKILIRYILEKRSEVARTPESSVLSPSQGGENIINSELEILTSMDLAKQVAEAVGPEKILAKFGGGNDRTAAAIAIRSGLTAEVPRRSNIILVQFQHPDPAMAQAVLRQLLDTYLTRHREIHQGVGVVDDYISRQADSFRAKLSQTEEELKRLKTSANVISLEDTKRAYVAQVTRIQDELLSIEAELAERKAVLGALPQTSTQLPTTNATAEVAPPDKVEQYRAVVAEVDGLRQRERDLLLRLAAEHPFVKNVRELLTQALSRKQQLEQETPALLSVALPAVSTSGAATNAFAAEEARVLSLQNRIEVLTNQLQKIQAAAMKVVEVEPTIIQLQRQRDVEEASFRSYSSSLEQQRMDESLSAGKITNISVIQNPTPPGRDMKKLYKPMGMALAAGLFGGLALAFLLEKFLNQSIRRAADLERVLHIPLLLSVPDTSWKRKSFFNRARRKEATRLGTAPHQSADIAESSHAPASAKPANTAVVAAPARDDHALAPWDADHELRAYYEGLRDRLITYFEVRNMTHKPKLVALTSCHQGAGVTTMAAGLAAALSETGDGNVLLVDMNAEQGSAQAFHKGKLATGLSEAFEADKAQSAKVQENLYLVSARESNDQKLPRVMPKRFASLVPKMKASDYDFIIFDMPPVSQTSITPRLSSYMDMVLMVLESERTGQELAKRANSLLSESKANVTAVLNKSRAYVPDRLRQEL